MLMTISEGAGSLAPLIEEIERLAEHARLHGPAPDCAAQMEDVSRHHRARIEAARQIEREASREPNNDD